MPLISPTKRLITISIYFGVSKNRGTPKIIHFNRGFHYKSSILGGKPPIGNIHFNAFWVDECPRHRDCQPHWCRPNKKTGSNWWKALVNKQKGFKCCDVYHLESRWRNSHVLVYHGPLLSHLLGVAPSTFSTMYIHFGMRYTRRMGKLTSDAMEINQLLSQSILLILLRSP